MNAYWCLSTSTNKIFRTEKRKIIAPNSTLSDNKALAQSSSSETRHLHGKWYLIMNAGQIFRPKNLHTNTFLFCISSFFLLLKGTENDFFVNFVSNKGARYNRLYAAIYFCHSFSSIIPKLETINCTPANTV